MSQAAVFARKSRRYAPGERHTPDNFEQGMESPFSGTYMDPNHPSGSRTVKLFRDLVGEFRLAEVHGIDGPGEPEFSLTALVYDDQITVDFGPKGGPGELTGFFAGDAIRWPDGNKWPFVAEV